MQLLGGFALADAEGPIDVPQSSAKVLAILGLRRAPVPRSELASDLWPQVDPRRALGNLRSAVWRLPAVARQAICGRGDTLAIGPDVDCDIHSIDADAARACPRLIPPSGARLCAELLPGWYDDWILVERERLGLYRAELFERLSDDRRQQGRVDEAVFYAVASISVEPLRESAHRALLRAHAEQKNLTEMRRHYRTLVALLADEIGVPPSPETDAILMSCGLQPGDAAERMLSGWDRCWFFERGSTSRPGNSWSGS